MAQSDGFQKHPENINKNGRPKKGTTITDIVKQTLRKEVNTKEGKKQLKEIFSQKIIDLALTGDIQAIKLIWNYDSGMPVQKNVNEDIGNLNINLISKDEENI